MYMRSVFLVILLLLIIFVSSCAQGKAEKVTKETANLDSFAKCLTEKGVKMYGSYICSGCLAQIKMFGGHNGSFRYVDYIECHPRGPNPQTDLCLKRDIKKTPTWTLEKDGVEIKRIDELQTFESLAEFSGCSLK